MNLFEISKDYQIMFNDMQAQGIEPEIIADTLASYSDDIDSKIENVAKYRENLLATAKAKKELADKLNAEVKALNNKALSIFNYIDESMKRTGKESIEYDYFKISYRKNPASLQVTDAAKIPELYKFTKVEESIDKNGLKAAMKDGLKCEGAELITDKTTMVIK